MKKVFLLFFCLSMGLSASAQEVTVSYPVEEWLTDSLKGEKFGSYIYLLPEKKIAFFCSSGFLAPKNEAEFLRIAEVSPNAYELNGHFEDYYLSPFNRDKYFLSEYEKDQSSESRPRKQGLLSRGDKGYFKNHPLIQARVGKYRNGVKHGRFIYYHRNGKIKARGNFDHGRRAGTWEFYYEDGLKYKVIDYNDKEEETLLIFKNKRGKDLLKGGKGKFKEIREVYEGDQIKVTGKVLNGKPHGKWKAYLKSAQTFIFVEEFNEGKLISSKTPGGTEFRDSNYTSSQIKFSGQEVTPFLNIYTRRYDWRDEKIRRYAYIDKSEKEYKLANSTAGNMGFYEEIQEGFSQILANRSDTLNGYFLVEAKILGEGYTRDVHIYSTIKDEYLQKQLKALITERRQWVEAPGQAKFTLPPNIFFQINVENNEVSIPQISKKIYN